MVSLKVAAPGRSRASGLTARLGGPELPGFRRAWEVQSFRAFSAPGRSAELSGLSDLRRSGELPGLSALRRSGASRAFVPSEEPESPKARKLESSKSSRRKPESPKAGKLKKPPRSEGKLLNPPTLLVRVQGVVEVGFLILGSVYLPGAPRLKY